MDNKKLTEHGVKWGVILGFAVSLIRISPWFINPETALDTEGKSNIVFWLGLAVFIGLLSYIGLKTRRFSEFITYKQALRALFVTILVHGIISFVVDVTVFIVNKDKIDFKVIEAKEEAYSKLEERGMTDEQIEQSMKWFDLFTPSIPFMIAGFFLRLGVNSLFAMLIAKIVKRNPPVQPAVAESSTE